MKFSYTSRQKDLLSLKLSTKIFMQLQFLCYTELYKAVSVKNFEMLSAFMFIFC
jgi:hypothetical protein